MLLKKLIETSRDGEKGYKEIRAVPTENSVWYFKGSSNAHLTTLHALVFVIGGKLYRMGFRGKGARSTLADANESRDWRI